VNKKQRRATAKATGKGYDEECKLEKEEKKINKKPPEYYVCNE